MEHKYRTSFAGDIARGSLLTALCFGLALTASSPASAASEDECAIWLCAPGGFPSGCGGAKSAMMSRIKKDLSPIPKWAECFSGEDLPGGGSGSANYGPAALIPEHKICVRWRNWGDNPKCVEHKTIPKEIRKGTSCRIVERETQKRQPEYCTKTLKYIDIYIDGSQVGETYYY